MRPAREITRIGKKLLKKNSAFEAPSAQPATAPPAEGGYGLSNFIDSMFATPDEEVGWLPFAVSKGLRIIHREKPALIYTTSPPHSVQLIGYGLKWLTDLPWIADFQDPWTLDPWRFKGTPARAFLERKIMEAADTVIFNTPHARQAYVDHYGSYLATKSTAIPNGFDPRQLETLALRRQHGATPTTQGVRRFQRLPSVGGETQRHRKLTLMHAGSLYSRRNPFALIEAVSALHDKGALSAANFHLTFLGTATMQAEAEAMLEKHQLVELISFVPPVPHEKCLQMMRESAVLVILQPDTRLQVPAKLYEYGYLEKPILAVAEPDGAVAEIIQKYNMGVVVPNDASAITEGLTQLLSDFQRGWETYRYEKSCLEAYSAPHMVRRLAETLNEMRH